MMNLKKRVLEKGKRARIAWLYEKESTSIPAMEELKM